MDSESLRFLRSHRYAVQASVASRNRPQAAVIGYALDDDFSIIFDTLQQTRKAQNLYNNPYIALVIGGFAAGDQRSVQYEGIATFPEGRELEIAQSIYFDVFPEGRDRLFVSWPTITYVRVLPRWLRFSDFSKSPAVIAEFNFADAPVKTSGVGVFAATSR